MQKLDTTLTASICNLKGLCRNAVFRSFPCKHSKFFYHLLQAVAALDDIFQALLHPSACPAPGKPLPQLQPGSFEAASARLGEALGSPCPTSMPSDFAATSPVSGPLQSRDCSL